MATHTPLDDMVAELIPVTEWVYDLYKVTYWVGDPEAGGRLLKTVHITSSCENHLSADVERDAPHECNWTHWERVKENVGHPRVIGQVYGFPMCESGIVHGTRIATM